MTLAKTICAFAAMAALVPGTAVAHDGDRDGFRHHRHHGVLLKGTVTSIDASNSTLVVKVAKA